VNSEKRDYLGWILSVVATLFAIYGAVKSGGDSSVLFAAAVVLLVIIERRPAKVVTASLIRIADEKGAIRGLVGWGGGGIQVGIRAAEIYNKAVSYSILWQTTPSVAFTLRCSEQGTASGEIIERSPSIVVSGQMARDWRSYSLNFSYKEDTSEPAISVCEHRKDGVLYRSIPLS